MMYGMKKIMIALTMVIPLMIFRRSFASIYSEQHNDLIYNIIEMCYKSGGKRAELRHLISGMHFA